MILGSLCTAHPLALPVLHDLGCVVRASTDLVETCCASGNIIVTELEAAIGRAETELAASWLVDVASSLDSLLDHVVREFHRPFVQQVATLSQAFAAAQESTHHPSWSKLRSALAELDADLSQHIEMEERVVFPWIRSRNTSVSAHQTIRALQLEHGDAIDHLLEIDAHAQRGLVESGSDPRARAAVATLHQFERRLCEHIHVESNALFPRVLQEGLARR